MAQANPSSDSTEGAAMEHAMLKSRMFLDVGDEFALQTLPARGAGQHVVGFVTARGNVSVEFLDGARSSHTCPRAARSVLETRVPGVAVVSPAASRS
jgi:hypothetical protein